MNRLLERAVVEWGVPPRAFRYRWIRKETLQDYAQRTGVANDPRTFRTIHAPSVAANPLPRNVSTRNELPTERGWWHHSFWDIPKRKNGATVLATLNGCRVVPYIDDEDEFWVAITTLDDTAIDLREFHFREGHARVLASKRAPVYYESVTWLLERVFHNYSHWLTAHLPKFLVLEREGKLEDVLLPSSRPRFIDDSLRMVGIDPSRFRTFEPGRPLMTDELTVLETDRFRPELLLLVREAVPIATEPFRKVYISRSKASRRRLLNEDDEIWPLLERAGFQRVHMEDLTFDQQVRLMRETEVLFAPHGAGLTNMIFCAPGTHVVEIADLSFPNPNFYAVAAAMQHHYWLLSADGVGDVHPLEKDLVLDAHEVEELLSELPL